MLNHTEDIDEQNFYVEKFDTLDGTHWEIALDIQQQIQEILDREAEKQSWQYKFIAFLDSGRPFWFREFQNYSFWYNWKSR